MECLPCWLQMRFMCVHVCLCVCVCTHTRVYFHIVYIPSLVGRSVCVPVFRVRTLGIRRVQTFALHCLVSRTRFGSRWFTSKAPGFLSPMLFVTVQCCPQDRPVDMSFYAETPRAGLVNGWTSSPRRAGSGPDEQLCVCRHRVCDTAKRHVAASLVRVSHLTGPGVCT